METLTPASTCRHARIHLTTSRPTELIDLTDRLQSLVSDAALRTGVVNVQNPVEEAYRSGRIEELSDSD